MVSSVKRQTDFSVRSTSMIESGRHHRRAMFMLRAVSDEIEIRFQYNAVAREMKHNVTYTSYCIYKIKISIEEI